MSTAEPSNQTATCQALQAALQTLKERCQTFQRRIALLEEENGTLRTLQAKTTNAPEHAHEARTELRQLRETIVELTHQKMQMAEQIAMVGTENRQLWRRLSLFVKDHGDVEDAMDAVGPSTTLVTVNQQLRAPLLATTTPSNTNQTDRKSVV